MLFGLLHASSSVQVDNAAVSAFVNSKTSNAGGLFGTLNVDAPKVSSKDESKESNADQGTDQNTDPDTDSVKASYITRSYYGGRTTNGAYSAITIQKNNESHEYETNVNGQITAGGFIGSYEAKGKVSITQCFSTGSVQSRGTGTDSVAGGFIGTMQTASIAELNDVYSMGTVLGQNALKGGFIGKKEGSVSFGKRVYYLKTFNGNLQVIGNMNAKDSGITTVEKSELIDGSAGTDLSVSTIPYDPALQGQTYPYKNWTKSDNQLAYYGDWPSVPEGTFVYYEKYKDGTYGFYYYDGNILRNTLMNKELEKKDTKGYGVISQFVERDKVGELFSWYYSKTGTTEEPFDHFYGSTNNPKYDTVVLGGLHMNLFKVTSDYLHPAEGDVVMSKTSGAAYVIKYIDGKPLFVLKGEA